MKKLVSLFLTLMMALSLTAAPAQAAVPEKTVWNLSAIYPNKAAFESEFTQAEKQISTLAALRGKLSTIDRVVDYYKGHNELYRLIGRLDSYANLQVYMDLSNSTAKELSGRVVNLSAEASARLSYALPELFANSAVFLDEAAKDAGMAPYLNEFTRDRINSAHTLPEAEEQLLQPVYLLQNGAANLFSSLVNSDMPFPNITFPDGTEKKADEINYNLVMTGEYTQEFRKEYSNDMLGAYGQYRNTLAQNLQNQYTAITKIAAAHRYNSALDAELSSGDTPASVYNSVFDAAKQAMPVQTRYYALLKKSFNLGTIYNSDMNMSLCKASDITYPYTDAQTLVKAALAPLGEDYAAKLDTLMNSAMDVYPAKNKLSGCFTMQVPGTHPYILLNYNNDFDSASNMAHELGHGVHMLYSQTQESTYNQGVTSLTSEVTSTLNQLLFSDYMMKNAKTEEERQYYAARELSFMKASFFTQVFFARFQESAVQEVENGKTLTTDKLDKLWMDAAREYLLPGKSIVINDSFANGWARIPHFYQGFYVYQYAVGIAAACNIADRIESGEQGAVEDYLTFLKAGNSGNAVELLKLTGIDISNGSYIQAFTARFERLLSEFDTAN